MPLQNKISVELPTDVQEKSLALAKELDATLSPFLIALSPEERVILPKMADGNLPFVEKTLEYAQSNPEHAPRFLVIDDLKVDLNTVKKLLPIVNIINKLYSHLNDTLIQAGSEAYVASLAYYKGVKLAADANELGARPISDDLGKRFKGNGARKEVLN